jgi:hypothetical protein
MKKIAIITKSQANKMLIDSLFQKGGTLNKVRLCMGKYSADKSVIGKMVDVAENVVAVFPETRKDVNGNYLAIFCLTA